MKKIYIYAFSLLLTQLFLSCNEEPFAEKGDGSVVLNATINSHMDIITRADQDNLKENLLVWISNSQGPVRKYTGADLPTGAITLASDSYVAEAWAGDSVPASFDKIYYKGATQFDVEANKTTAVKIDCKIANVAVCLNYDNEIEDVLSDIKMTIGHKAGKLTYEGIVDVDSIGYFMMPSYDKNLSYELTGKQIDGSDFKLEGFIPNPKVATKYILNVICNKKTNDVGGLVFSIKIDETEMEYHYTFDVIMAPKIVGYGFDITNPVMGQEGTIGNKSVYISSADKLQKVLLESNLFKTIPEFKGNPDVDLMNMQPSIQDALESYGVNYVNKLENSDSTLLQINFTEFPDTLHNGDYNIRIVVTDNGNRTSEANLRFLINDASVVTSEPDPTTISYTSAVLKGTVAKDDVESVGFRYHKVGESEWIYVPGELTRAYSKGDSYTALLTGLQSGQKYEYKAVSDDFESQTVCSFETKAHLQLPNASFENWYFYNNKIWVPGDNYTTNFWDTGNHGSTTLGASYNITTRETNYVHEGNFSACLSSKFIIAKFGAGNVFAGKYLKTDGTDGVIGMGRPFTDSPKSVRIWVRYEPAVVVNRKGSGDHLKAGDLDQGQIYIALTDNTMDEYNGEKWPYVVKTKPAERNLFNPNDARVIAYGEHNFESATTGDGMELIEIDFDYKRPGVTPSNIIFTISASKYGDYFEGGDGTKMYVDDIELVYED